MSVLTYLFVVGVWFTAGLLVWLLLYARAEQREREGAKEERRDGDHSSLTK
jgi:hypothetical protein